MARVSATLGCREPPSLSGAAAGSARGLRAPAAHVPSAKLLTLPKTSLRGQMLEQRVAGSMPTGQLKKLGHPGQPVPSPRPLLGGSSHLNTYTDTHRYRYSHTHGGRGIYGF